MKNIINGEESYTSNALYTTYVLLLIASIVIMTLSFTVNDYDDGIIALPVILILVDALFTEKRTVNIPPVFIMMLVGMMILLLLSKNIDTPIVSILVTIMFGVVLGLAGLIVMYSLLRTMPTVRDEKPFLTSFVSVSIGISFYLLINMASFYIHVLKGTPATTLEQMMGEFVTVLIGTVLVAIIYYLNKHNGLFRYTVDKFLENNSGTMDANEYETREIRKAINSGESEMVEYKSTLRTNLATGEKDPRMEKAVLKTLVAFLNTNGGTLIIGAADDGSIVGIDEESFDNRDKLNLHMTHLIANHIGNEFLHFISFRLVDYEGKGIMRVVCQKSNTPVFLIENKTETFFVRSGPSSIDLHGTDMLRYAATRFKLSKRNKKSLRL